MFTNLLIVVAAGLLAPLALGFFPRVRLPAIVLEILLGIVIGPSGLGWAKPDAPVSILALVGLAFLLFLSGLEIDTDRLRGRIVTVTALGFAVSFVIAILIGANLRAGGLVKSPLFVAIVLVATSLGVVFPVLKDSHTIDSSVGQLVIAAASIAEFGSIILLSLFFSGKNSASTAGRLILLAMFGLVVVLVGVAIASAERSMSLSRVLRRLQDTTAQIRVRAAFLLMIGFTALADRVGLETILGAFAAGALVSLLDRDEMTHPQFRLKLEAVGFGVFIPIFFVTSGLRFDLSALFASSSTIARVPLFLLAILLTRGLPALVYVPTLGLSRSLIAGVLQATTLPFIVAATQIGLQLGVVSPATAAGLVAAGLLSVVISPALGLVLLRRDHPETAATRGLPTPGMPVLTTEDRALCRANDAHRAATPPLLAQGCNGKKQLIGLEISMKSTKQAIENMEYVRRLLEQKQPEFAASLEIAASLVETRLEEPVDDELIRLCAASAPVACRRVTPRYLSWFWPELRRRKRLDYTQWFGRARTQHQGVLADRASYDGRAPSRIC